VECCADCAGSVDRAHGRTQGHSLQCGRTRLCCTPMLCDATRGELKRAVTAPFGRRDTDQEIAYATLFLRSNESPYVNARTLFFNGLRFCGIVGSRQLKCGPLRSRSRSGHRIVIRVSLLHELRRRPNRWIFSVLIILLVEQNARRALAASQRAYVLEQGRIAFSGSNRDARRPG
jgi:hypothetical protein